MLGFSHPLGGVLLVSPFYIHIAAKRLFRQTPEAVCITAACSGCAGTDKLKFVEQLRLKLTPGAVRAQNGVEVTRSCGYHTPGMNRMGLGRKLRSLDQGRCLYGVKQRRCCQ